MKEEYVDPFLPQERTGNVIPRDIQASLGSVAYRKIQIAGETQAELENPSEPGLGIAINGETKTIETVMLPDIYRMS